MIMTLPYQHTFTHATLFSYLPVTRSTFPPFSLLSILPPPPYSLSIPQVRGTRESVDQAKHLIGGVIAMGPGFLTAAPSNNQQQPANETTFGQTALEQARALARHQLAQAGVVAGALTPSSIPPQPHMSQNNPQQTMSAPPAPSSQSMSMSMSQQQQQQYKSDLDPRPSMDPNQGPLTSQQQEERARLAAQGRRPLLGAPAGNVQGGKGGDVSGGGGGGGLTLSHEVLDTITCPLEKMSLLLGNQVCSQPYNTVSIYIHIHTHTYIHTYTYTSSLPRFYD